MPDKNKSKVVERLRSRITMEQYLQTSLELFLLNAIHELGYREEKEWEPEEQDILVKIRALAISHAKIIQKRFK